MPVVTPTDQATQHAASLIAQREPVTWTVRDRTAEWASIDLDERRAAGEDVPAAPDLAPLLTLVSDQTGIDVARKLDGTGYVLAWTDHVVNEWDETHADLSTVFARVAVLQRCAESGWDRGFAQVDAEAFVPVAAHFLEGATTT